MFLFPWVLGSKEYADLDDLGSAGGDLGVAGQCSPAGASYAARSGDVRDGGVVCCHGRGGAKQDGETVKRLRNLRGDESGVDSHAGDRIHAQPVQCVNLRLLADAARHDELTAGECTQAFGDRQRKALQSALRIDVGVEKASTERLQGAYRIVGGEPRLFTPAAYSDVAVARINAGEEALRPDAIGDLGGKLDVNACRWKKS